MLLREYLNKNNAYEDDIILLKHKGAKQPFCCRRVFFLTGYELGLEVLEELPTDNIKCDLYRQDILNRCTYYLLVEPLKKPTINPNFPLN